MGDVFIEKIVKKRLTPVSVFVKAMLVLGVVVLFLIAWLLTMGGVPLVLPIVFVGAPLGAWKLNGMLNLEFEYILTNGDLDIDKIVNRRTRKRLTTINYKDIEIIAPVSDKYKKEFENASVKKTINAAAVSDNPDNWFIIYATKNAGCQRLIFEPDRRIIDGFRVYIPRKVMIK